MRACDIINLASSLKGKYLGILYISALHGTHSSHTFPPGVNPQGTWSLSNNPEVTLYSESALTHRYPWDYVCKNCSSFSWRLEEWQAWVNPLLISHREPGQQKQPEWGSFLVNNRWTQIHEDVGGRGCNFLMQSNEKIIFLNPWYSFLSQCSYPHLVD